MDGEESLINLKKKILEQVKYLTNNGKHKEASELFDKHFPNFGGNQWQE
jgi:hypothetical protein